MNSFVQLVTRFAFLFVVLFVVASSGRPLSDVESDDDVESILRSALVPADSHERSFARKRHAEIRLSSEIARRLAELKRIQALNQLMADLDTSQVYTVKNSTASTEQTIADESQNESPGLNNNEVYPTSPSFQALAPQLLKQINGETINGGLKIKVINGRQVESASTNQQFKQSIQDAQNAVALARTCTDMQKMLSRNNLRLRVRCRLDPRERNHRTKRRRNTHASARLNTRRSGRTSL